MKMMSMFVDRSPFKEVPKSSIGPIIALYVVFSVCAIRIWPFGSGLLLSGDNSPLISASTGFRQALVVFQPLNSQIIGGLQRSESGYYILQTCQFLLILIFRNPLFSQYLFILCALVLASIGMYVFSISIGLRKWTSFWAGLLFGVGCNQFNLITFGWIWVLWCLALFPWTMFLWQYALRNGGTGRILCAGAVTAVAAFGSTLLPVYVFTLFLMSIYIVLEKTQKYSLMTMLIRVKIVLAISLISVIPHLFWIVTLISTRSNLATSQLANSLESLGTSINVSPLTPLIQWGTGSNQSFEHLLPSSLIAVLFILPILGLVSIVTTWRLLIPRSFFLIMWFLFVLATLEDQRNVIGLLGNLHLGRDSARLYMVSLFPIIILAASAVDNVIVRANKRMMLLLSILIIGFTIAFQLPFYSSGVLPKNMPDQPGLALTKVPTATSDFDRLNKFLELEKSTVTAIGFPRSTVVLYRDNPRFQWDYHNSSNLLYQIRLPTLFGPQSRLTYESNIAGDLDVAVQNHDLVQLDYVMDSVAAKYLIFDSRTLTDSERDFLNYLDHQTSVRKISSFKDISSSIFGMRDSSFRVFVRASQPSVLHVENDFPGTETTLESNPAVFVKIDDHHYLIYQHFPTDSTDGHSATIWFKAAFQKGWRAHMVEYPKISSCTNVSSWTSLRNNCGRDIRAAYKNAPEIEQQLLKHVEGFTGSQSATSSDWGNSFEISIASLKHNSTITLVEFRPAVIQHQLIIASMVATILILVGTLYRKSKFDN